VSAFDSRRLHQLHVVRDPLSGRTFQRNRTRKQDVVLDMNVLVQILLKFVQAAVEGKEGWARRVLAFIVYQATPRDPLDLAGVVLAMLVLGLLATWIPARRALSINPLILLREE
jgi:hypothetical protein